MRIVTLHGDPHRRLSSTGADRMTTLQKIHAELPDFIRNLEVSMGDQYGTHTSRSPDAEQIADAVKLWLEKLLQVEEVLCVR